MSGAANKLGAPSSVFSTCFDRVQTMQNVNCHYGKNIEDEIHILGEYNYMHVDPLLLLL